MKTLKDYAEWLILRQYPQLSENEAHNMDLEELLEHLEMTLEQLEDDYKKEVLL